MPCPRCQGFVITQYEETRCLLCGWILNVPVADPIPDIRHEAMRWISVLCGTCNVRRAIRGREQCRTCQAKTDKRRAARAQKVA